MRRLGDLEAAVMERLWAVDEPVSVRHVLEELNRDRVLAYTTVMTVLDNLHRKGLVTRTQSGRAYLYLPARSREEHTAGLIAGVLADAPDRTAPLLRFVETLTTAEVDRLRAALDAPADTDGRRGRRARGRDRDAREQSESPAAPAKQKSRSNGR